jgi:Rieske Fe-S protein
MEQHEQDRLPRRQVIEAGVAGAALLVLPEACGSTSGNEVVTDAGGHDATHPDATAKDAAPPPMDANDEPDATLVDGGGACEDMQTDWTRPISIMKAGIALKGTAYAFTDTRFADIYFDEDRILLVNPLTGSGYVAMSGVCTHQGCSPNYFSQCIYSSAEGLCTAPEGGVPEAGPDAEADADSPDAAKDSGADAEAGADQLLTDVLYCPCHGSVYNALTGVAIYGPAVITGNLQLMKTCVGGGYVFVFIPNNAAMMGSGG